MEQNPELSRSPTNATSIEDVLHFAIQHGMLSPSEENAMQKKEASITVRMNHWVKEEAEKRISMLGLSVSALVNALYRQIVYHGDIPEEMLELEGEIKNSGEEEFEAMMRESFCQSEKGELIDADEAIEELKGMLKT